MSDANPSQPFADLTPHAVLDALANVGLHGDGRLMQLNSYENRVFQVALEDGSTVVAKFYRPGRWSDAQILEEHGFALELERAEVPVVAPLVLNTPRTGATLQCLGDPPTLARDGLLRYAVAPRRAGRAPDLDDVDTLTRIGRFIGRMHAVARQGHFHERRPLNVMTLGRAPREWLLQHNRVASSASASWAKASQRALDIAQERFDAMADVRRIRVHGDCHPGNLLWTPQGPHCVDLDDATTAPAVQDLWMLLSGEAFEARRQIAVLLEGYEDFCDFDRRELLLIEPLRTLRMIHHGAWLAERFDDPAFPIAFPWFGSPSYWAEQTQYLLTQIDAMSAP